MNPDKNLVVVVGAGVTGLQTSISLLQFGYDVAIVAKHFPGDKSIEYTSPWAGAQWRSFATENEVELQQWDSESYRHWLKVIEEEEATGPSSKTPSGLARCKSLFYGALPEEPWFSDAVLSYQSIPEASLEKGFKHGHTFISILTNAPMYIQHLYETAQALGVIDIRATLPHHGSLSETLQCAGNVVASRVKELGHGAPPKISAFVNATGLSAHKLVPDPNMFPIRGQTVLVAGEATQLTTLESFEIDSPTSKTSVMYIIPRPRSNTTVLGGTKQEGDWNGEPDPATTKEILRRAKRWAPELLNKDGEFDVLSVQVGLRPGRKGGPRVELEEIDGRLVCHAYGHGAAGYQLSIGSAKKVVRLLSERLEERRSRL
ncbi:FAD dependent oxidoreductase [Eremomyces bilateralis CBS 781.70]|uniref:FAD dependent oxidoreductase n=1 Tax=Eremomyces bilateralis CBS 781.70 TaxID=1392243 RepID=A0A6G1GFE6_9PEZI|nr:FAD dependent oxidoreductase [Eremomyces bilateralis CBS 781.70]KAF1816807.1 FAD dependent oxidoreductase [Eremomyces bilateralis CBS 781.70]